MSEEPTKLPAAPVCQSRAVGGQSAPYPLVYGRARRRLWRLVLLILLGLVLGVVAWWWREPVREWAALQWRIHQAHQAWKALEAASPASGTLVYASDEPGEAVSKRVDVSRRSEAVDRFREQMRDWGERRPEREAALVWAGQLRNEDGEWRRVEITYRTTSVDDELQVQVWDLDSLGTSTRSPLAAAPQESLRRGKGGGRVEVRAGQRLGDGRSVQVPILIGGIDGHLTVRLSAQNRLHVEGIGWHGAPDDQGFGHLFGNGYALFTADVPNQRIAIEGLVRDLWYEPDGTLVAAVADREHARKWQEDRDPNRESDPRRIDRLLRFRPAGDDESGPQLAQIVEMPREALGAHLVSPTGRYILFWGHWPPPPNSEPLLVEARTGEFHRSPRWFDRILRRSDDGYDIAHTRFSPSEDLIYFPATGSFARVQMDSRQSVVYEDHCLAWRIDDRTMIPVPIETKGIGVDRQGQPQRIRSKVCTWIPGVVAALPLTNGWRTPSAFAYDPERRSFAIGTSGRTPAGGDDGAAAMVFNDISAQKVYERRFPPYTASGSVQLAWWPDGRGLMAPHTDSFYLWSLEERSPIVRFVVGRSSLRGNGEISASAMSPDCRWVAGSARDGREVLLWRLDDDGIPRLRGVSAAPGTADSTR